MLKNRNFSLYIILFAIFAIAFLLRVYKLSDFPVGFHIDEASLGYNGYSLLLTGKDDNNKPWPLYIDMFGDNRPSGYHYLTILPVMFFGLTEFATRLPGAFFGSLTIFTMYLLSNVIFRNKIIGLLSAFLVAVSPWHIVLSRASAEVIIALFFILIGFSLLLEGFVKNKNKFIISGAVFASISYFFYHTPRVFVPLAFAVLTIFLYPFWSPFSKYLRLKLLLIFIFLCGLVFCLVFFVKGGTGRYSQVNIFNNFETNFFLRQEIQEDAIAHSPKYISRLVHNKFTNDLSVFLDNYFDYFSGDFLFTKGGLPIWYSIPRMGLMYIVELPFLLFGIYLLLKSSNKMHKLPLLWLLTAPVVGAITMDDIPNINRSIIMIPALEIIVATGFYRLIEIFNKKKMFFIAIGILFLGNIFYFGNQYFVNAKVSKPWYRNNGFSEMMQEVRKNYEKYDLIAMSKYQGGIYPLILFYMQYDPKKYQEEGSPKNKDYGGFGKFFFIPQDCPSTQTGSKLPSGLLVLYIDKGDCPSDKSKIIKEYKYIYREDGTKAFRIVYE